mmetsp:Transcript_78194/g.237104  ORF Transcript_78194/g.237104 Transcript_78194/m.237104 type:complete len:204 (+) Transcript_78194:1-612(+)
MPPPRRAPCLALALLGSASPDVASLLRQRHSLSRQGQLPSSGDAYDYGDGLRGGVSDYSPYQFLDEDYGDEQHGHGSELDRSRVLREDDDLSSDDEPEDLGLLQAGARSRRGVDEDDDPEGYEYGDRAASARHEDSSDFSVHQFLAQDEGREGSDTSQDKDGGAAAEAARARALAEREAFHTEDTPEKSLLQAGGLLRGAGRP